MLDDLPQAHVDFLARTSILEVVNGDLGDAMTGGSGADGLLERLQGEAPLVESIDSRGGWYRYHPLLRQMLQAELRRDSPELIPELHTRAADAPRGRR